MNNELRMEISHFIKSIYNDKDFFEELDQDLQKQKKMPQEEQTPIADQIVIYRFGESDRLMRLQPLQFLKESSPIESAAHFISKHIAKSMSWISDKAKVDTGFLTGKSATKFCIKRLENQTNELENICNRVIKDLQKKEISYLDAAEICYIINLLSQSGDQIGNELLSLTPLINKQLLGNDELAEAARNRNAALLKKLEFLENSMKETLSKAIGSKNYSEMKGKLADRIEARLDDSYEWESEGDIESIKEQQFGFIEDVIHYQNLKGIETLVQSGCEIPFTDDLMLSRAMDDRMLTKCQEIIENQLKGLETELTKNISEKLSIEDAIRSKQLLSQIKKLSRAHNEIIDLLHRVEESPHPAPRDIEKLRIVDNKINAILQKTVSNAVTKMDPLISRLIQEEQSLLELEATGDERFDKLAKVYNESAKIISIPRIEKRIIEDSFKTLNNWDSLMNAIPPTLSEKDEQFLAIMAVLVYLHSMPKDSPESIKLIKSIKEKPEWIGFETNIKSIIKDEIDKLDQSLMSLLQNKEKLDADSEAIEQVLIDMQKRRRELKAMVSGEIDIPAVIKDLTFLKSDQLLERMNQISTKIEKNKSKITKKSYKLFQDVFVKKIISSQKKQTVISKAIKYDQPEIQQRVAMEAQKIKLIKLNNQLMALRPKLFNLDKAKTIEACLTEMRSLVQ